MDRTAQFYAQPTYVQRGGGGLPVYSGSRRQRGGNVLGAIKGFLMPFLSGIKNKAIQRAKSEAFGLAKDVALDAFTGKNIAQSLKNRGLQRAKRLGKNVILDAVSQARPSRKRKQPVKKKNPPKKRAKRAANF